VTAPRSATARWRDYAAEYDLLARLNPYYQALLARVAGWVSAAGLPAGGMVVDLGGGTGNFSLCAALRRPDCTVVVVDGDAESLRRSAAKAEAAGAANLTVRQGDMAALDWLDPEGPPRLFLLIHALYVAGAPEDPEKPARLLRRLRQAVRPGDAALISDIGRPIPALRWGVEIAWQAWRTGGWRAVVSGWRRTPHARVANRAIVRLQRRGRCLMHDLPTLIRLLRDCGFPEAWVVESSSTWFGAIDSSVLLRCPREGLHEVG